MGQRLIMQVFHVLRAWNESMVDKQSLNPQTVRSHPTGTKHSNGTISVLPLEWQAGDPMSSGADVSRREGVALQTTDDGRWEVSAAPRTMSAHWM